MQATKTACALALSALALTPFATAQWNVPPAEQLDAFQPLLGKWKGSGEGSMDGQPFTWTSATTYELVLGGHFVEEITRVDVPNFGSMVWHSFFGYDKEAGEYVAIVSGNNGEVSRVPIHWVEDNVMCSVHHHALEGELKGERWYTTFEDDEYTIVGYEWTGQGAETKHVWGSAKRVEELDPIVVDAAFPNVDPSPEIEQLQSMAGEYSFSGTLRMGDGAEMPVSGTETMKSAMSGYVMSADIDAPMGDGNSYRAIGLLGWNPSKNCYSSAYVSNFGEIGIGEMRWADERTLVRTAMRTEQGIPIVDRAITTLDADGKVLEVIEDRLQGTASTLRAFEAKYELKKD